MVTSTRVRTKGTLNLLGTKLTHFPSTVLDSGDLGDEPKSVNSKRRKDNRRWRSRPGAAENQQEFGGGPDYVIINHHVIIESFTLK